MADVFRIESFTQGQMYSGLSLSHKGRCIQDRVFHTRVDAFRIESFTQGQMYSGLSLSHKGRCIQD